MKWRIVGLAAFVVCASALSILLFQDDEGFSTSQVEDLFAEEVDCESPGENGVGVWSCSSGDGEATVQVNGDGGYSSEATGLPAPGGCCLTDE